MNMIMNEIEKIFEDAMIDVILYRETAQNMYSPAIEYLPFTINNIQMGIQDILRSIDSFNIHDYNNKYSGYSLEQINDKINEILSLYDNFNTNTFCNNVNQTYYSSNDKKTLCSLTEASLQRQIWHLGIIQYLYLEKIRYFNAERRQQVGTSFCRSLLELGPEKEIAREDVDRFHNIIEKVRNTLGKPTAKSLLESIRNYKYYIIGRYLSIYDESEINNILRSLGSSAFFIFMVREDNIYTALLGVCKTIPVKFDRPCVMCIKELAHTPLVKLSNVATTMKSYIYFRKNSFDYVIQNKWMYYYRKSDFEREINLSHDYTNIKDSIIRKSLDCYQIRSMQNFRKNKEIFLQESIEATLYHELGHNIHEDNIDPLTLELVDSLRGLGGLNIADCLVEALADWSFETGERIGTIQYFIQTAKVNYPKAKRMVYVYISDYWFLDLFDDSMRLYSDIIVNIIVRYINANGEVDFTYMDSDFFSMHKFLLNHYNNLKVKTVHVLKSASFTVDLETTINFTELCHIVKKILNNRIPLSVQNNINMENSTSYWTYIIKCLEKFSPLVFRDLQLMIEEYGIYFNRQLCKLITNDTSNGDLDLRKLLLRRCKEVGFFTLKQ